MKYKLAQFCQKTEWKKETLEEEWVHGKKIIIFLIDCAGNMRQIRIAWGRMEHHSGPIVKLPDLSENPTCLPCFTSVPSLKLVFGGKKHHFFTAPPPPKFHHSISTGLIWLIDFKVVFKGTVQRDFRPSVFFIIRTSLGLNGLKYFWIWLRIRGVIRILSPKIWLSGVSYPSKSD